MKGKKITYSIGSVTQEQRALEIIINNLPAMVFYKNLDGEYIAANEAFCRQLHTTPENIKGKTDFDFYNKADAEKYHQTDLYVINSGNIFDGFQEEIDVDGIHRNYTTRKILLEDNHGDPYGILGLSYDVTLQKSMERDLQSLANYNQAIIRALPDLVFLFDVEGNFLDCFTAGSKDLMYPTEYFIGKNISAVHKPAVVKKTLKAIRRCMETDKVQTFNYSISGHGGDQHYEARFSRIGKEQALCISRNITDRVKLENDLVKAKDKAEESSQLKSVLIKNISHELRTPLNGIIGFADLLRKETGNAEHREMLTLIHDSGKRLMKTLNAIMMLSALSSGHRQMHPEETDINMEMDALIRKFQKEASKKGLYLKFKPMRPGKGFTDRYFFSQLVSHIIENAIKFTKEGGVIISASLRKTKRGRSLNLLIKDTGIGISKANQKMIFEEFRQASEGNARRFEGPGLGLTIALKITRILGGTIHIDSETGKGSTFRITLPLPADPQSMHEIAEADAF